MSKPKQKAALRTSKKRQSTKRKLYVDCSITKLKNQYSKSSELPNDDQNTSIATHTPTRKLRANSYTRLVKAIRDKRLSDSLDYLENFGYCSEDAIRKINYLQHEGIC